MAAHLVDSFAAAAARTAELGRRIMLTIGSKQLKHFSHLHKRVRMFARILPSPASLEQALAAGFRANSCYACGRLFRESSTAVSSRNTRSTCS